jgi:uncharacterized protein (TIGR02996 family)
MSDRAALLRTILAAPADDAPRLVYADWCDEHGEPERAKLIRLMCHWSLAFSPSDPCTPSATTTVRHLARKTLLAGIAGLFGVDVKHVLGSAVSLTGDLGRITAEVSRGFLDVLACPAADWLQHADAITAEQPVRTVRLTTMPDYNVLATYALIQSGTQHVLVYGASDMPLQRGVGPTQREAVVNALAKQWPRVKFELPPKSEDRRIALLAQHEEST